MSWPAPNPPAPVIPTGSEPHVAPDAADDPGRPRAASELRLLLRAVPPAAWIAVLGAALVLIAAGIVVSSSWGAHGPTVRALAIILVTGGLAWASERGRRIVPLSAAVTAHVATFLVAPAGIAVAAMFGATWPLCLLVGGALATAVTEIQSRRWSGRVFRAGQVAAMAIAATGTAALTGTAAGVVAAIAAVGLVALGAHRRAAALAVMAVASPMLWALADEGIGAGTFARAGLVGERLGWSGPVVGLLAALVLAISARRVGSNVLMLAAGLSVVAGAVTGLAAIEGPGALWWSVPALVVIVIESVWWLLPNDAGRRAMKDLLDIVTLPFAVLSCGSPLLVWFLDLDGALGPAIVPPTVTAVALSLVWFRWRTDGRAVADLAGAAVAVVAVTAAIAAGIHPVAAAAVALAATLASSLIGSDGKALALYPPAAWTLLTIAAAGGSDGRWSGPVLIGLLTVLGLVVVAIRTRPHAHHELAWFELGAVVLAIASTATTLIDDADEVVFLVGASLAILAVVACERRLAAWACFVAGAAATLATAAGIESSPIEPSMWIGWAILAACLLAVGGLARSWVAVHAATVAVVGAVLLAAASVPVAAEQVIISAMVAAVTLTGLATAIARRSPLDTAAVASTVVAVGASGLDVHPMWVSAVWFLVGLQVVVAGFVVRQPLVQLGGAAVATAAAISTWFTSGANEWFVEVIEPLDITVGDLWMAAAAATALAAGIIARRTLGVNSWVAYPVAFAISAGWLAGVQIGRDTVWALPLALTIGMLAAAVGAWRRLAAVLVGGVAMVVLALVVAIGDGLTDVPTWAWLATGGLGLLGVAVLIERMGRNGAAGLKELAGRWQ